MGKLLRFPANRIVHTKPKEPELTEEESQKIKVEKFIEQVVEQLSMDIINVLQDNVVDMKSDIFLKDISIIIEGIKGLLYRDFDIKHPMHDVTDALTKIFTLKDGRKMTDINYSRLSVRKFKEPTKPQPEIKIEFEPDMNLE
mgnify:FL=1|jgi:hypothetical protein|tara:strand:- start:303 stop:728 length:426 start_codon:yes stop_codon:yes gene_type:complete